MNKDVLSNKVIIFNESDKNRLPQKKVNNIIKLVLDDNNINNATINVIYCDDNYIHKINVEYLKHDYPTDIITFTIEDEPLLCELYISIDTAQKNADFYKVTLSNELLRLAAHGALHIVGYNDSDDISRDIMKSKEDYYLQKIVG
ncbi:MAG TPA: rRNA maturation RNase YbeY [Candidatus Kapabacteria bacterium]|nr:rRNA maturation RNase YbeY [Candidatus Kapabacteria bacterium]